MLINRKIAAARKYILGMTTQEEMEPLSGIKQSKMSTYEREAKLIPPAFFDFLRSRGVDMNAMFDDKISVEGFIEACKKRANNPGEKCALCDEKDKRIRDKEDVIFMLRDKIATLEAQLAEFGVKPKTKAG